MFCGFVVLVLVLIMVLVFLAYKLGPFLPRLLLWKKGGNKQSKCTSSSLNRRNWVLGVGKTVVFGVNMSMRKF